MNGFAIRAGLMAFCLIGAAACCAEVPQAYVNPIPLKLPVESGSGIHFSRISTAQGLSQIRVMTMVQDDRGFMWFGTLYGLNRFDGYTFKVYAHERGNANSLSGVDLEALFKDRDGALWMGCEQALDRFDPKTETFTHFPVPKVKQISQDHAGLLWLSTDRGLYRLDPKSGNIRVYTHDAGDPDSLPDNHVVAAAEDKAGKFWVGSPYGVYEFDRASGHIKLSIPLHTAARDLSFYEDRAGEFWILYGTGNGLAKFDRERNVLTYYSFQDGDLSSTAYSGVDAMLEDRLGNLWLAKQGLGLLKFDREHNRFISYTHKPGDSSGLADVNVIALYEDRDGSIWASLPGSGLQRFSPVSLPFQSLEINHKESGAGCFYEDSHGNRWFGTGAALYRIEPSGVTTAFSGVKAGALFDVLSIVEDRAGFIWAGTSNNGLFRLDPKNGQWKSYRHDETDPTSLSNNVVFRLMVDHEGTLWAATWDGIDRFDPGTDRFTTYKANPLSGEQIYLALTEDSQHNLWLGTNGFGLQQFNPRTGQFTVFRSSDDPGGLSDNSVISVLIARNGALWIGTPNGLNEFDLATKHFTVYDTRDGMASSAVACVLEDGRGKLWMSTTKGISSFDPATKTFRNFSTAEGLPGPEMASTGACLRDTSGRMYFSGFSGATTFLPEAMPESNSAPPMVITDFRLLGNAGSPALKVTPQAISYTSEITLSHQQTPFSLTFAALSYSDSPANRYRYMLEGQDNSWIDVGSDGRTVTYNALAPKKYRFRVQGATNSSRWSEPGAELEIIILPAWYQTYWFFASCAAVVLLVVWVLYRIRVQQIAEAMSVRFDDRLSERTRIARDLHDTLLQTIQGSKLAADSALKRSNDPTPMRSSMEQLSVWLGRATDEGRAALNSLRTSTTEKNDLAAALRRSVEECRIDGSMEASFLVTGEVSEMHPIVRDEVYRIGYEAIRNACLHSQSALLQVELTYAEDLVLRVRDNGVGMDPAVVSEGKEGHFGLRGMRERAQRILAKLTVESSPGSGTEIRLVVPGSIIYRATTSSDRKLSAMQSLLKRMGLRSNSTGD